MRADSKVLNETDTGEAVNPDGYFRTACLVLQVYIPHIENPSTSYLERQKLGNGTPGRIRTCDLLLRRQQPICHLVDSLSFFFGLVTWFYGVFGRYCSLVVP